MEKQLSRSELWWNPKTSLRNQHLVISTYWFTDTQGRSTPTDNFFSSLFLTLILYVYHFFSLFYVSFRLSFSISLSLSPDPVFLFSPNHPFTPFLSLSVFLSVCFSLVFVSILPFIALPFLLLIHLSLSLLLLLLLLLLSPSFFYCFHFLTDS